MLALTSDSANAWNLIENKKYNHSQINDLIPVLSFIQPIDLTHFLWGKNISFDHIDSLQFDNAKIILEKSNPDDSLLNKAIFSDGTNRNELLIIIKSRIPSIDFIDFRKSSCDIIKYQYQGGTMAPLARNYHALELTVNQIRILEEMKNE